jgi:hypothetical protein
MGFLGFFFFFFEKVFYKGQNCFLYFYECFELFVNVFVLRKKNSKKVLARPNFAKLKQFMILKPVPKQD